MIQFPVVLLRKDGTASRCQVTRDPFPPTVLSMVVEHPFALVETKEGAEETYVGNLVINFRITDLITNRDEQIYLET